MPNPNSRLDGDSRDRIVQKLKKLSKSQLSNLVASILRASGYYATETNVSSGSGVDILAGAGGLGFGKPHLCVQVRHLTHSVPMELREYKQFRKCVVDVGAQYGLLVSLTDFACDIRKKNERSFFQIRLWGPYELVDRLLENYDSLPEDIRADIPLQTRRVPIESDE